MVAQHAIRFVAITEPEFFITIFRSIACLGLNFNATSTQIWDTQARKFIAESCVLVFDAVGAIAHGYYAKQFWPVAYSWG